jgi:hypothetical protein
MAKEIVWLAATASSAQKPDYSSFQALALLNRHKFGFTTISSGIT